MHVHKDYAFRRQRNLSVNPSSEECQVCGPAQLLLCLVLSFPVCSVGVMKVPASCAEN